jgi:hypothetical protein
MKPFNFIHIPKCGGTTMSHILKEQCKLLHIDREYRVDGYEDYDVIFGHHSYKVYDHLPMVTWIRNPIERVISQYFQFIRKDKIITYPDFRTITLENERQKTDILEYIERIPNIMLAYLGSDPKIFEYIGHLEEYDKHLRIFGKKFGFKIPDEYKKGRVSKNKIKFYNDIVNDKVIEKIKEVNKLDIELYKEIVNGKGIGS